MEQIAQQLIVDSRFADKAAALGEAVWHITQRVAAVMALLTFTYGLLVAEGELAKIETMNAAATR